MEGNKLQPKEIALIILPVYLVNAPYNKGGNW